MIKYRNIVVREKDGFFIAWWQGSCKQRCRGRGKSLKLALINLYTETEYQKERWNFDPSAVPIQAIKKAGMI